MMSESYESLPTMRDFPLMMLLQMLQGGYNTLNQKMAPSKTYDPLAMLPLELAVMVIESLEMRDRV